MYDHFEELLPQVRVLYMFCSPHRSNEKQYLTKKTSLGQAKTIPGR